MAEPATSTAAVIVSAFGLTIFGIATGLHPSLLITGLAGGLWALFYGEPQPLVKRCLGAIMSSLVAAWIAPVTANIITKNQETGYINSQDVICSQWFAVTPGDYYQMIVSQNTAGALNLLGTTSTFLQAEWC